MEMRPTMQPTRRQRPTQALSQAQHSQFDRIADRFEALEQRDADIAVLFERMDGRMTAAERAIADIANTLRESAKEQREEKRTSVPNAQGWLVIALMLCALLVSLLNIMPHVSLH